MNLPLSSDGTNLSVQTLYLLSGQKKKRKKKKKKERKKRKREKKVKPAFQAAARFIPSYTLKSGLVTRIIRNQ